MIEKCQCGNDLNCSLENELFFGRILFESNEDGYADFLSLEVEELISLIKEGKEDKWFSKKKDKGFPDDIFEGTFMYDLLGKAKLKYMDEFVECNQCGMMYVSRGNKIQAYKKVD